MQNIPPGLIPYNHEKYLTGKYIAETRLGFRPDRVEKLDRLDQPIIYVDEDDELSRCYENGVWSLLNSQSSYDLFLRPKTVKKWHPVLRPNLYNSEDECKSVWENNVHFLKAVEVEVNEE